MNELPDEVEFCRDRMWRRDETLRIESVADAERFVEEVGFCAALTDSRKPLPSLYIAVCGRRDAVTPRNVQKDPEVSAAWTLKDEVLRRGRVYYGKLCKGQALFVAKRLIPAFNVLFGVQKAKESEQLSANARAILKILRKEYESASADLRKDAGINDRQMFNKALDELQGKLKVIPSEVLYEPKFTYIWTLAEVRFPEELEQKIDKEIALTEIARAYLIGAGQATSRDLAKNIGVTPLEANLGLLNLVEQDFATQISGGTFRLKELTTDENR
jgi:hypothetical protein